jgi:hypothetical protein
LFPKNKAPRISPPLLPLGEITGTDPLFPDEFALRMPRSTEGVMAAQDRPQEIDVNEKKSFMHR